MSVKAVLLGMGIMVSSMAAWVPASAQSKSELNARLISVENDLRQMKAMLEKEKTEAARANLKVMFADLTARLNAIEGQLRAVTGRLEEMEQRQRQFDEDLESLRQKLEAKQSSNQDVAQGPAGQKAEEKAEEANKQPEKEEKQEVAKEAAMTLPAGSDKDQYDFAFSFVRKQELDKGVEALKLFIDQQTSSPLISNAHYWLGRVYQKQKKLPLAAQEFLTVIQKFGKSDKYPDALVDLADVLMDMKADKKQVCSVIDEFNGMTAKASDFLLSRAARLYKEAQCQ